MKNSNLIFSIIVAIIFLSSCTKQDGPVPSPHQNTFTGIVFNQVKYDSCNTIAFIVRKKLIPGVDDTIYYDTNTVFGITEPSGLEIISIIPNPILTDSITLQIGDNVEIESWKTSDQILWGQEYTDNYKIHMKVYKNGIMISDITENHIKKDVSF